MMSLKSKVTAVMALVFTGAALYAAPAGKPAARTSNTHSAHSVLIAAAPKLETPDFPAGGCPNSTSCQGIGSREKQMLELINAARIDPANNAETGGRAQPLKWDPKLAQAAIAHSQDMAGQHYFSHIDPNGQSPVERIYQTGVRWVALGENIAKNPSAARAEETFMSEPRFQRNHRANILESKFNCVGIGIVRGPDGLFYVTQDFAEEP